MKKTFLVEVIFLWKISSQRFSVAHILFERSQLWKLIFIFSFSLQAKFKKMVRVKTFLGCFPLETGGICLGWFFFSVFFIITSLIAVFGWLTIISKRKFSFSFLLWVIFKFISLAHPLYTLVWLDVIIFLIIVVYSSWLMVQGIKTVIANEKIDEKNHKSRHKRQTEIVCYSDQFDR